MAIRFAKVDADLDENPKIEEAGFWGATVFQALLRINRKNDFDGLIPRRYCRPGYLARKIHLTTAEGLSMGAEELIRLGLRYCTLEDDELIEFMEDGGIRLLGWDEEWRGPASDAERARKYREKKKAKEQLASQGDTDRHDASREQHDSSREITDVTKITQKSREEKEKKRVEKKKKEEELRAKALAFSQAAISKLNQLTGSKYQPSAKQTLEDCEKLVSGKKPYFPEQAAAVIAAKVAEWQGTDYARNLRPSTLLRPSNFRRYVVDTEGAPQNPATSGQGPTPQPSSEDLSVQQLLSLSEEHPDDENRDWSDFGQTEG